MKRFRFLLPTTTPPDTTGDLKKQGTKENPMECARGLRPNNGLPIFDIHQFFITFHATSLVPSYAMAAMRALRIEDLEIRNPLARSD